MQIRGVGYTLIKKDRPMLKAHQSKNINLLYIYIISTIVILFLEQSMSYNYENNFVQTLNATFLVITFLGENSIDLLK